MTSSFVLGLIMVISIAASFATSPDEEVIEVESGTQRPKVAISQNNSNTSRSLQTKLWPQIQQPLENTTFGLKVGQKLRYVIMTIHDDFT